MLISASQNKLDIQMGCETRPKDAITIGDRRTGVDRPWTSHFQSNNFLKVSDCTIGEYGDSWYMV